MKSKAIVLFLFFFYLLIVVKVIVRFLSVKTRPTLISRVRDIDSFIDLNPPVSIKASKPYSLSPSRETPPDYLKP